MNAGERACQHKALQVKKSTALLCPEHAIQGLFSKNSGSLRRSLARGRPPSAGVVPSRVGCPARDTLQTNSEVSGQQSPRAAVSSCKYCSNSRPAGPKRARCGPAATRKFRFPNVCHYVIEIAICAAICLSIAGCGQGQEAVNKACTARRQQTHNPPRLIHTAAPSLRRATCATRPSLCSRAPTPARHAAQEEQPAG